MDGRTDGQTGVRKLTVTLSNFANAPKNGLDANNPGMLEHFEYAVIVDKKRRAHSECFHLNVMWNSVVCRKFWKFLLCSDLIA
jgi:hypothetical protein